MKNDFGKEVYNHGEYTPPAFEFQSRHPHIYGVRKYYKNYYNNKNNRYIVEYGLYTKIVHRIFELIVDSILRGNKLRTPFGSFRIWKVRRKRKAVDYTNTNLKRKETGDNTIVIHRTNEYYYRIDWTKHLPIGNTGRFKFEVNMLKAHEIPKYEKYYIDVPLKE